MLTEEAIQNLTNEKSFVRGKKYYKQGRVSRYIETEDLLEAVVIGTDNYQVKIDLTNLDTDCNCPAFSGNLLCKHQIAVFLTKIHGKVTSNRKTKIKEGKQKASYTNKKSGSELPEILKKMKKEELVAHLLDLSKIIPDIEGYFTQMNRDWTKEDYKELQQQIRAQFRGLGYTNSRSWGRYTNNLDWVSEEILRIIRRLPANKDACKFILDQVYWIHEKKLTSLDDSYGIIGDLAYTMIIDAVQYLNTDNADLSVIWEFTSRESSFDFGTNILEAIFETVKNKSILSNLSTKVEKAQFKKDSDFNFNNDFIWAGYMNYLAQNDYEKFKELVIDMVKEDQYLDGAIGSKLITNEDYGLFIDLFENSDNWHYRELLQGVYKKTKSWDKLIKWYEDELFGSAKYSRFSMQKLKELKPLVLEHKDDKYWVEIIQKAKATTKLGSDAIDLFLYLKDFETVYTLLTGEANKHPYTGELDFNKIEVYAKKLEIISDKTAIRLYKFLVENELEKFKGRANRYDNFLKWLDILWEYKEKAFVQKTKEYILKNLQNKRKLVERLSIKY